ncbi:hypothetical protein MRX96_026869 [Rhipicephalus microplus]
MRSPDVASNAAASRLLPLRCALLATGAGIGGSSFSPAGSSLYLLHCACPAACHRGVPCVAHSPARPPKARLFSNNVTSPSFPTFFFLVRVLLPNGVGSGWSIASPETTWEAGGSLVSRVARSFLLVWAPRRFAHFARTAAAPE